MTLSELTGPGPAVSELLQDSFPDDSDLTTNARTGSEAIGERIILTGRISDERGAAVPKTLVEIWQANAAGRYRHGHDTHRAPLDPNFVGYGRSRTNREGLFRFVTIRPGPYPFELGDNAWRSAHIHFSLLGPAWPSRLITQMYFPGDPLHEFDAIFLRVPRDARSRVIARYDPDITVPYFALGYRFNIVLRGRAATPLEAVEQS